MTQEHQKLLVRARKGDLEALNELVLFHQENVRQFVRKRVRSQQDAQDICQEVLIRACLKLGTFKGRSTLQVWLISIARRAVADFYRARGAVVLVRLESVESSGDGFSPRVGSAREDVRGICEACQQVGHCISCIMRTLSAEQQLAVILCDIYGFTDKESSEILRGAPGKFKHLLHEARGKLDEISGGACALVRKAGSPIRCAAHKESDCGKPLASAQLKPRVPSEQTKQGAPPGRRDLTNLRDRLVRELEALLRSDLTRPNAVTGVPHEPLKGQ